MELQNPEKTTRPFVFHSNPLNEMNSIVNHISGMREFKKEIDKLLWSSDLETSLGEFVEQPHRLDRLYCDVCIAHCKLFHDGKSHESVYSFLNEHLQTTTGEPLNHCINEFYEKFRLAKFIKHERKCQTNLVKSLDGDLAEQVLAIHEKVYEQRKEKFLKMWRELSKVIDECVAELQQRLSLKLKKLNA